MAGENTAVDRLYMASEETRNAKVSFDEILDDGELLTGAVSVSVESPEGFGLTTDNEAINAIALQIKGQTIAIGRAVQFSVTAPEVTERTEVVLKIAVGTDATPPQSFKKYVPLIVGVN